MKTTVNQVITSLATIAWGAVPVYFYASGHVVKYLAPTFHLITLTGGLLMIVLGLFNLIHARKKVGCGHDHHDHGHDHDHDHDHDHGDHAHCDHDHDHGKCDHDHDHDHKPKEEHAHDHHAPSPLAAVILMILPVLLCTAFTNHDLSARALAWKRKKNVAKRQTIRREPFTRASIERSTPKSSEGNYKLTITELFWSAGDEEIMKAYRGLPAEMEGRILDEEDRLNPEGNRKQLYRVFMSCCAADAQVYGIPIEFQGPLPTQPDKTWVKVIGTVEFGKSEDQDYAYLKVSRLVTGQEPPPQNPFQRRF